jgi:cytochrome c oxidase subunit 2
MYSNASNFVEGVDTAFAVILGISFFFILLITSVMVYFIVKYNRKRNPKATQIKGSVTLEIVWTLIPAALVIVMFYFGWRGWRSMQDVPEDAMEVTTIARMWSWTFEYENGKVTDTLYVPINEPIVLDLKATDVIHSLYIPAFRLKQDMVPGKEQLMWFIPGELGEFDLFCAEYCGLRHAFMTTSVVVMPEKEFYDWYADTTATGPAGTGQEPDMPGLQVLRNNGCLACHSLDGTKIVGPTFKGLYGHGVTVKVNGELKSITADEDYIRRSIYEPNVEIVEGYNQGLMQSYEGVISEEEMKQIIEYLKTISNN